MATEQTKNPHAGAVFAPGQRPIVIDVGSFTTKAGFAKESAPEHVLPTRDAKSSVGATFEVWRTAVQKLGANLNQQPVLVTQSIDKTAEDEMNTRTTLLTKLCASKCFVAYSAVLASYAAGRLTSLVIESGHSSTFVVPVIDGYAKPEAVVKVASCGESISEALRKGLKTDIETAHQLKKNHCYVALDYDAEVAKVPTDHKITDNGHEYQLGQLGFQLPEALMAPSHVGEDGMGLAKAVVLAVKKCASLCDEEKRKELYENIILTGGTTLLRGLSERLTADLSRERLPAGVTAKIVDFPTGPELPIVSTWIGGSILASLEDFQAKWVSQEAQGN